VEGEGGREGGGGGKGEGGKGEGGREGGKGEGREEGREREGEGGKGEGRERERGTYEMKRKKENLLQSSQVHQTPSRQKSDGFESAETQLL
jgi:hypothetical protein